MRILTCLCFSLVCFVGRAQVRIYDPARTVERSVEYRANSRVNQSIDRGLDKVEEGIINAFKKKPAKPQPQNQNGQTSTTDADNPPADDTYARPGNNRTSSTNASEAPTTLKAYSRFDFVPGEKLLVADDFMQDAVGDFPAKWNATGSGEIVTIEGVPGHWLALGKKGQYLPEYISNLPDNFTLQFDLACSNPFNFYSTSLHTAFAALKNPAKEFAGWGVFKHNIGTGTSVSMHPMAAGAKSGSSHVEVFENGERTMNNDLLVNQFWAGGRNLVKVSVWRQRQRLRVYVNEEKIWDLPRAFLPDVAYNSVVFALGDMHRPEDSYYLGNLRLAVGAPDTRNKLVTEGKFVTRGILFNVGQATIKPESFGALKDIANVLTENADLRVLIVGHTDADGDDATNLTLSKRRAEAVKAALSSDFGINASRLTTDGKGETQPATPNTTPEGKANNRRVEFIKQ
ncbi:OmpA family protein [Fibrella aquatilis]|uniref:OmpA family protein n=1 Tax=Fibrella aquatilis TaxID=2817059 RepID=A0A939G5D3_9BACT|nr:OmpA family protein [Fibrella aquatilis]MBO0932434.1 OmpA family protein [Fibrella aquatilis]